VRDRYEADFEATKCTFIILQQNARPNENIKMINKLKNDITLRALKD